MSIINGFGNIPDDTAYAVNRFNIPTITEESGKYVFNFNLPFSYEANKILNIQGLQYGDITVFENPYININNTGNKQINGIIRSGKYYNLMWTGVEWITQVTTLGVSTDQIVITSSGTYTIDPDISYNLIAIGGGGGGAVVRSTYYYEYTGATAGGSGAKIEDVFTPTSDTITVTVGAAGANTTGSDSAYGGDGGDTIIAGFTAGGGTGGYAYCQSSNTTISAGKGGTYSGGNGYNGKDGSYAFNNYLYGYIGTAGEGWTINGVIYGQGGAMSEEESTYNIEQTATAGVIILTPIL